MMRLIDADALIAYIKKRLRNEMVIAWMCRIISEVPTIEADPVRHGRWEFRRNKKYTWCADAVCTACETVIDTHVDNDVEYRQEGIKKRLRYCPNCGAKMDLEE